MNKQLNNASHSSSNNNSNGNICLPTKTTTHSNIYLNNICCLLFTDMYFGHMFPRLCVCVCLWNAAGTDSLSMLLAIKRAFLLFSKKIVGSVLFVVFCVLLRISSINSNENYMLQFYTQTHSGLNKYFLLLELRKCCV